MYRTGKAGLEVLLVHPGGPFWAKKDVGSWSIPKGEHSASEDPLAVAVREFEEETGLRPSGTFRALGEITQPSRKIVMAWAVWKASSDARPVCTERPANGYTNRW